MRSGHTRPRDPRGGEETGSDRPGRHHRRRIAPRLVAPRFPVAARGRDAARQSRAEIRRHRGAAADSDRDRQASLCEADHGRGFFIPERKHWQNGEVHHPLPIHAASARRRLRAAALRPQGKESGPWIGFKQDGFSRKDGTTETQDRRRLALRAARKPVPVAAMRLRQHPSRQPAVAGRTVAQARARGRNRQGGLEMSTEKEILALEDRRCAAMTAGDLASLEKLLHDELLYTHSSGVTDTKASWLLSMKSGKTRYKSVKCSGQQVRIFGDVALVTGRGHIEAEINGQPRTLRLMFLNAWAKTPQGWKFVAWQSTPQPV